MCVCVHMCVCVCVCACVSECVRAEGSSKSHRFPQSSPSQEHAAAGGGDGKVPGEGGELIANKLVDLH